MCAIRRAGVAPGSEAASRPLVTLRQALVSAHDSAAAAVAMSPGALADRAKLHLLAPS
jgi:hypothetical protein